MMKTTAVIWNRKARPSRLNLVKLWKNQQKADRQNLTSQKRRLLQFWSRMMRYIVLMLEKKEIKSSPLKRYNVDKLTNRKVLNPYPSSNQLEKEPIRKPEVQRKPKAQEQQLELSSYRILPLMTITVWPSRTKSFFKRYLRHKAAP